MTVRLYDAIKSSYGNKKAKNKILSEGYIKDKKLSSENQKVFYNPEDKKLLVNVAGSHNLKDAFTDVNLAFGNLKNTSRYKEAKKVLEKAKKKYDGSDVTVTGHSLGGSIGAGITSKKEKFLGFDSGYTLGQQTRGYDGNHQHYRTAGDLVSILGSGAKDMQTLKAPKKGVSDYIGGPLFSAYNAHLHYDNIKKIPIK